MKIKVKEIQKVEKIIDVEFPYYYKYNWDNIELESDSIHGKIIGKTLYRIQETKSDDGEFDYDLEKRNITNYSEDYFKEENKSTKEEFEAVMHRALKSLNDCINEPSPQ